MNEDKIIKTSSLAHVLNNIFNWMPFKKTKSGMQLGEVEVNDEVILGVGDKTINSKNIFEIRKDGKIYVLDVEEEKQKPLQEILNRKNSIVINNQEEWFLHKNEVLNPKNIGTIVYLAEDLYLKGEIEYKLGIYIISIDANNHGNAILTRFATTSSVSDDIETTISKLDEKVNVVETNITELNDFKNKPLSNSEIEIITDIDLNGDGHIG